MLAAGLAKGADQEHPRLSQKSGCHGRMLLKPAAEFGAFVTAAGLIAHDILLAFGLGLWRRVEGGQPRREADQQQAKRDPAKPHVTRSWDWHHRHRDAPAGIQARIAAPFQARPAEDRLPPTKKGTAWVGSDAGSGSGAGNRSAAIGGFCARISIRDNGRY